MTANRAQRSQRNTRARPEPTSTRVVTAFGKMLAIPLVIIGAGLLFAAGLAPTAGALASAVNTMDEELFDFPPLPDDLQELSERSVIADREGNHLAFVREEDRQIVTLDEIPEHVQQAVIATEDQEFYDHAGVSWMSIVRALAGNLQAGEITAGGSTITQQLVKNLVLETNEQTLGRKLQEAVYATELENRMSKDEILESYLNTAFFGNRAYGVAAAAETYWSKPISELTVPEAAVLAGLLRAPHANEPISNPENAETRRNIVLRQMSHMNAISGVDAEQFIAEPMEIDAQERSITTDDYVVSYLIEELRDLPVMGDDPDLAFQYLATGGVQVETTIHPELQDLTNEVIRDHLSDEHEPLGAMTTVDPRNGQLLAFGFGPRDFGSGEGQVDVNPAVPGLGSPGRQSGSAFKAFEVVAALEAGVSPAYTIDTPSPYEPTEMCAHTGWEPGNFADSGGGVMDMTRATAVSSNIYFAHLVDELTGPEHLKDVAERMGISKDLVGNCAGVLGTDDVHMLDMASAFGTLANRGVNCEPFAISRILDSTGEVIYEDEGDCDRAIDEGISARATEILRAPVEGGTAQGAQVDRPAAGKTGTTQNHRDAWFVGYVPQLSTAVWVGNELGDGGATHPSCPEGITGGCVPAAIWASFMSQAFDVMQLEAEDFPDPPPLPTAAVPSVVGQEVDAAVSTIEDAGFRPVVEEIPHHADTGEVTRQTPSGDSRAPSGSQIRLMVSDGTEEDLRAPDLIGLTEDEAESRVSELDLELAVELVPVDDIGQIGAVVDQSPEAGTPVDGGDTVAVEVGRPRGPGDEPPDEPTDEPPDEPDDEPADDEDDQGDEPADDPEEPADDEESDA